MLIPGRLKDTMIALLRYRETVSKLTLSKKGYHGMVQEN